MARDNLGKILLDRLQPADLGEAEARLDDLHQAHQFLAQQVLFLAAHHLHGEGLAEALAQQGVQHPETQPGAQVGQFLGSQVQVVVGLGQEVGDEVEAGVPVRRRHLDDLRPRGG